MNSIVIKCLYNINVLAGYTGASLHHRGPSAKQRQNRFSGLPPLLVEGKCKMYEFPIIIESVGGPEQVF